MDAANAARRERLEALRAQRKRNFDADSLSSKQDQVAIEPEAVKTATQKSTMEELEETAEKKEEVVYGGEQSTTKATAVMEKDLKGYFEIAAERNNEVIRELQRQKLRGD